MYIYSRNNYIYSQIKLNIENKYEIFCIIMLFISSNIYAKKGAYINIQNISESSHRIYILITQNYLYENVFSDRKTGHVLYLRNMYESVTVRSKKRGL